MSHPRATSPKFFHQIKSPHSLIEDMQHEIFGYLRTASAARAVRVSKETRQIVSDGHESYINSKKGNVIKKCIAKDFTSDPRNKFASLPDWFYKIDLETLELIGLNIINLSRLIQEEIENPYSFFKYIFDKRVLRALRQHLVTLDQLIDLLTLKGRPEADDAVDALFASEACGEDVTLRLGILLAAQNRLISVDITVDQQFVAEFLNKEIHGPLDYETYLDDLITTHESMKLCGPAR